MQNKIFLQWQIKDYIHLGIIVLIFLTHQILEKVLHIHISLLDKYLDPLLAMPIFLSGILLERRYVFYKTEEYFLSPIDIIASTLFMSIIAEVLFPYWNKGFTADWWDVLCYVLGSIYFYLFMNKTRL